jgi:hypothetical protein
LSPFGSGSISDPARAEQCAVGIVKGSHERLKKALHGEARRGGATQLKSISNSKDVLSTKY